MESRRKQAVNDAYLEHFRCIYARTDQRIIQMIQTSIEEEKDNIVAAYFDVLASTDQGRKIFTTEIVNSDMAPKLARWLSGLFVIRKKNTDIDSFIEQQLAVGSKYMRMNLPSHLLNLGARVLKMTICDAAIGEHCSAKDARNIYTQVTMIMDVCMSITLEAYLDSKIVMERRSQALQNHIIGYELAETCQNIRASMHDWHSTLLRKMLVPGKMIIDDLPGLRDSQFALWIRHKAKVFFKNSEEVELLNQEIDSIESGMNRLLKNKNMAHQDGVLQTIDEINRHIKHMSWLLGTLTEHARAMDSGRDTMTKLYNRRYLEVILQKELSLAFQNNSLLHLFMIDVDRFKEINDTHGHPAGDKVIENVAGFLYESVRTSDYVFRYGGDEFLILMVDATADRAETLAAELVEKARHLDIVTEDKTAIDITISLGIAQHEGESDYQVLLKKADFALLEAKKKGRNCYAMLDSGNVYTLETEDRPVRSAALA